MIGHEQEFPSNTRIEVRSRDGRTEFQIAEFVASTGSTFNLELPHALPVKWLVSGAIRRLARDVTFELSSGAIATDESSSFVWDGECARIPGPAHVKLECASIPPLRKNEALEIRGTAVGLEVWRLRLMTPVPPAVRRVFIVGGACCTAFKPRPRSWRPLFYSGSGWRV